MIVNPIRELHILTTIIAKMTDSFKMFTVCVVTEMVLAYLVALTTISIMFFAYSAVISGTGPTSLYFVSTLVTLMYEMACSRFKTVTTMITSRQTNMCIDLCRLVCVIVCFCTIDTERFYVLCGLCVELCRIVVRIAEYYFETTFQHELLKYAQTCVIETVKKYAKTNAVSTLTTCYKVIVAVLKWWNEPAAPVTVDTVREAISTIDGYVNLVLKEMQDVMFSQTARFVLSFMMRFRYTIVVCLLTCIGGNHYIYLSALTIAIDVASSVNTLQHEDFVIESSIIFSIHATIREYLQDASNGLVSASLLLQGAQTVARVLMAATK